MKARELGVAFTDAEVVALYRHRPPYPGELLDILGALIVEPRAVLDAGCGTGALARGLVDSASRIDAVDPSGPMLAAGRSLPRGADRRIRWQLSRAEDALLDGPYGLIACGASLHWLDHDVMLPRFRDALAVGARLAIVDTEAHRIDDAVRHEVLSIIKRYSPIHDHMETAELVGALVDQGRFELEDQRRTSPVPFVQSVDEYIGFLGSTSSLSRVTLGTRAAAFEEELRDTFGRHDVERIECGVVGFAAWGRPV